MRKRPPRKYIPRWVKRLVCDGQRGVCVCGCGQLVSWKPNSQTHFDHDPALILRDLTEDGSVYIPDQLDPDYLVARCQASHKVKTSGSGATTAGTDIGKMKKERKRNRPPKPKRRWAKRNVAQTATLKPKWPKRQFQKRTKP